MRKTTKAEKIAAYDNLARYHDATSLLHYLMAFRERDADIEHGNEEHSTGEWAHVRAQCWGLGRADGGLVLVTCWTTETQHGPAFGEAVVFAGYVSDMPDGGERYYLNAMGVATHAAWSSVRARQREAQITACMS